MTWAYWVGAAVTVIGAVLAVCYRRRLGPRFYPVWLAPLTASIFMIIDALHERYVWAAIWGGILVLLLASTYLRQSRA
jgi:uncharacterized membrane protein YccC